MYLDIAKTLIKEYKHLGLNLHQATNLIEIVFDCYSKTSYKKYRKPNKKTLLKQELQRLKDEGTQKV